MNKDPIIRVRGISKKYDMGHHALSDGNHGLTDTLLLPYRLLRLAFDPGANHRKKTFWALKDISFDVCHGEKIGIIGRNGAGKSTLLKILSRITYPTEGEARIRGRVTSLLEVGTGFNPNLSGRENIYLNGSLYGLRRFEIRKKFDEIVEFSGVEKFIDTPMKHYSTGMYVRLAFAVAAHLEADILLLDEVLAVGDIAFQQKCLKKVEGLASGGRTILLVSHSMGSILRFCEKAIWLEEGRILEFGDAQSVVGSYLKSTANLKSHYETDRSTNRQNSKGIDESHPESTGAELVRFEVSDPAGNPKTLFLRNEPIHIAVKYRVLRKDLSFIATIHLYKDGVHVFSSYPEEMFSITKSSLCRSKTVIPADMLNTGEYHLSLDIVTPTSPILRHVTLDHVLSFRIVEDFSPNQIFSGQHKGVVRPKLLWETSVLES